MPGEFGHTEEPAETDADGNARTRTLVAAAGETHPLTITLTAYVPEADAGAERICGFCSVEANAFGPVQLYVRPAENVAVRLKVFPKHKGELAPAVGATG